MNTLLDKTTEAVSARDVSFADDRLRIELSDGRELSVPYKKIPWLKWLARATPKQRADWSLEPGGYAIYWEQLDDGVEICHLLCAENLN
ncbi:MAG TPA: DUF2442 domain-containing protein [Verrucomicrobiae bacterium]|nr:DUF2442 domain-containing protein [Verrucomicrobiae bacterium]